MELGNSDTGRSVLVLLNSPCAVLPLPASTPPVENGMNEFCEPPMGVPEDEPADEPEDFAALLTAPKMVPRMSVMIVYPEGGTGAPPPPVTKP
jgi:hypothetical protein